MNIFIRTDASLTMGTGHVMRCLTLANKLRHLENEVTFICRELEGNLVDYIRQSGFEVIALPFDESQTKNIDQNDLYAKWLAVPYEDEIDETENVLRKKSDTDWLVVDHYALDKIWEQRMRPHVGQIMIIDDLANRGHDCDLLLDQNYYNDYKTRYEGLVPDSCCLLLGPEHVLLRDEFLQARPTVSKRQPPLSNVLVFFGGADKADQTSLALEAIKILNRKNIHFDIVMGSTNQNSKRIIKKCEAFSNVTCHVQVDNMAKLMAQSELALAAGGTTIYERMYLKLPSLTISVAQNQTQVLKDLHHQGYLRYLGEVGSVTAEQLAQAVFDIENDGLEVLEFEFDQRNNILWSQLQNCTVA